MFPWLQVSQAIMYLFPPCKKPDVAWDFFDTFIWRRPNSMSANAPVRFSRTCQKNVPCVSWGLLVLVYPLVSSRSGQCLSSSLFSWMVVDHMVAGGGVTNLWPFAPGLNLLAVSNSNNGSLHQPQARLHRC